MYSPSLPITALTLSRLGGEEGMDDMLKSLMGAFEGMDQVHLFSAPLLLCSSAPLLLCSSAPLLLSSLFLCSSAPLLSH
jgi:hypothetical protein